MLVISSFNDENKGGNGTFDFATSNELWRASLDTLDFMPLISADYGGGIIITDWYSENKPNESIKVTIHNCLLNDAVLDHHQTSLRNSHLHTARR